MILNAFSLGDKIAIVAGCDTGLGQGTALGLVQTGYDIVSINIVEPAETIKQVAAQGRRFLSLTADLRKIDGIPGLLNRVIAEFGHIDILMDNVGLIRHEDALEFGGIDWDNTMNLNTKNVFFIPQAAVRHFIVQGNGGEVISIASMFPFRGGVRVPSYIASENGVVDMTRLMANERTRHNINVSAIAPGCMAANSTQQLRTGEQHDAEILNRTPTGRQGLPSDLMGSVMPLASSASDYVNGYTTAVDGDRLARQFIPLTLTILPHDRIFCIYRPS